MSDTTQEVVRRLREDSPTVDAVCRQLERQVDAEEAELVVDFAEIFFSKAPPDFLHERSTDALAHMALGAFRFLQRSSPGRVDVEVLNPDVDNEGWYAPVTVIRTNISERPFVVDTIREYLHSRELAIEHYIYPVLHVRRDEKQRILDVRPSREGELRESLVHCEVARVGEGPALQAIRGEISRRLRDVVRATDDFQPMVDAVNVVIEELETRADDLPDKRGDLEEIQAFLRWLRDGAFVFLGYRAYDLTREPESGKRCIVVAPASGLGILRNEAESTYAEPAVLENLEPNLRKRIEGGPLLIISKSNAESTVHRRARMDYIGVKKLSPEGEVVGEHRFLGLFTSRAYAEEADNIPILREKLQQILDAAGVQEGSHDYKEINTIFNSMPKEELFLTSAEEIGADVRTVLTTYHSDEVRVTLREDPLQRGVSVMVILPKEKFSGEVRKSIEQALVQAFRGEVLNYHLALGEGDQARLHFYMAAAPEDMAEVQVPELERAVRELIRSWPDRVREGLERVRPPDEARRQARRYGEAFSAEYRAATTPVVAVRDILELEAMQADGRTVSIAFSNREGSPAAPGLEEVTELKVYLREQRLVLSDFMPILENAGLRVIAVNPFDVDGTGSLGKAIIYSFAVQDQSERPLDVEDRGTLLSQTILAVRAGDASNDILNSLVLTAGLHWREADVLRSYAAYAFQVGAVPSRISLPSALIRYPEIARILFELFEVKFDTDREGGPEERAGAVEEVRRAMTSALTSVTALSDDRALRRLLLLIEATVRTNYYRNGGRTPTRRSGGVPYTSFKFDAQALRSISRSRLLYEVWVRSSRMEGIHLRGARVARGGIRWSDRPDDFRTEVLGLVKTQLVKNAVIVPAGSKGGFVTLRQPTDPEEWAKEGEEQYRTLMRGLLDLTDNVSDDGKTVPPERVVRWDEDDPYLVVAADKGTAKFSDVANAVAAEYDFWLGDAFASGGSNGYDHKAVGITARGAWECVRRHFQEKGKDIQAEPFTVVGIGDMSGDVFGNGMLLSRCIKLLAAFDHRHVFIDPDPDPETSWEERKRLFELGRSSWDDYDRETLSQGGMIVPRGAKSVELSAEARATLGIEEDEPLDGEALIRAVLRAPAELLWNGGIGTYVKAGSETQADAGDPPNDAVRVDAEELRCEVVGEGGNLGFTQLARIEYALAGGRINTDALDNSGGVDLSDREVNLKILLNPGVRSGRMELPERNALLEKLTDPIAEHVLRDNRSQSLAVSLDEIRAAESEDDFRALMTALEKGGAFDRAAEQLPTLEQLQERQEEGGGLTRPELCVLLAHAKLFLMGHLLKSPLPDDPAAESYLLGYFPPKAVMEAGQDSLREHRLRVEIISSQITNDLVDLMGSTFVHRLLRDTGRPPAEIARAWLISARLAGHRSLLKRFSSQDHSLDAKTAYRWLTGLARVLERTTRWMLHNVSPARSTTEVIDSKIEVLALLRRSFGDIVAGPEKELFQTRVRELVEVGADEDFAATLITLRFLDQLLEIVRVARETDSDPLETGRAFYGVSELFQVPWLRAAIFEVAGDDRWEQQASHALADDLTRAHHRVLVEVMRRMPDEGEVEDTAQTLVRPRSRDVDRYLSLLDEVRTDGAASMASLSVAVREITLLAEKLSGEPAA